MSSLGEKLRREREARGVSLQEISAATRVNIKFLEALEKNDYSEYQAPVFITGFLRSYANHLGLDVGGCVPEVANYISRTADDLVMPCPQDQQPLVEVEERVVMCHFKGLFFYLRLFLVF